MTEGLVAAPVDAPLFIVLWGDQLRIGSFRDHTFELWTKASDIIMLVNPATPGDAFYDLKKQPPRKVWRSNPSANIRDNAAANALKQVLGRHARDEGWARLRISAVGLEVVKRMVTD